MARFYQPKKKTQLDTKHQQVNIERIDHHGAGIAFLNNKPVFIEGALPGEESLVQLTENKSKYSRAKLIKTLTLSEERVEPFCDYYQQCGGCNLQHLEHAEQLKYKQQSLEQLIKKTSGGGVELSSPVVGNVKGYRRRARISLKVNKKSSALEFGFRMKQSKTIVDICHCPVLDSKLNILLPDLKKMLSTFSNKSQLGHVELALGDDRPVLLLRAMSELKPQDKEKLLEFSKQHDVSLYLQLDKDNVQHLYGAEPAYSEVGVTIPFEPTNFIQVNQAVNSKMVALAIEWLAIEKTDRVLDLFCGLGNFSLPIAKLAYQVVGVEGVQEMVDQATNNAKSNGLENVRFYQANLEEELIEQPWLNEKFDKIILDPARAGAGGVVKQISHIDVQSVVYVSCNPATLARDCQSLFDQGFTLKKLVMLDMFPHTSHLESMALFEK